MQNDNTNEALVRAIWDAVQARTDIVTQRRVTMPEIVQQDAPVVEARFSRTFPVLKHFDRALDLAREGPLSGLADAFADNPHRLNWSQNTSYTKANCSLNFLEGYAYAGLSGPDGPIYWAAPRTGVMLMGPDVLYPGHNHAPREIYLLLTSGAQWRLDGGDWFDVAAGDLIFHDAWQMHEMRTFDEPMLAIAAWIEPGVRTSIEWDSTRQGATE